MSEKKGFDFLKLVGVTGALMLILFGSFQNLWRTAKLVSRRMIEG